MRYLIKYSKESNIKFISHLDLMRTIQRIIKRSQLPVEYSKGFNPHMSISIAQPLSVGMYSCGEYMDVVLTEEMSTLYVKDKLNESCPSGIKIFEVVKVRDRANENEKKPPQAMALIDAAKYSIKIKYNNIDTLAEDVDKLLAKSEWVTLKKSKSGEKTVDIKNMVKEFKYKIVEDNVLKLEVLISCGSKENLSADLLAKFIISSTKSAAEEAFVDIERQEMYAYKGRKLIPLYEWR